MAKCIMIQGTMSNVGKSIIAAGLCRIFKQDGYSVAPFKAQNMALNSYITKDKLEMGRAQVVQAEACGIEPDVNMNPILLKPTGNMSSQVIVRGKVVGDMRAMKYFSKKLDYLPAVREAYEELSEKYDIIVIEGAGSPAEINLKKDDIVNMGMAKLADAPVLLVGDIDRGGVFAQLIGTVMLLDKDEQERVKGLIINKFRGDRSILEPGLSMLEERCGKKVLGLVPYSEVDIEDEDSLAGILCNKKIGEYIDVAVIKLPRISNFTDFQALSAEKMVDVRYVSKPLELGNPDLVIIPGTKNTMGDLIWLRETGLEAQIIRLAAGGTLICGICGGFQMLGLELSDSVGAEEVMGDMRGLGLLPVKTEFTLEKTRSRVAGYVTNLDGIFSDISNCHVTGYEIHMGRTEPVDSSVSNMLSITEIDGEEHGNITANANADRVSHGAGRKGIDGCVQGNVLGTYLHGFFDDKDIRDSFIKILCEKKGIDYEEGDSFSYKEYKEQQYDRLADILRESLDMGEIYRLMGLRLRG